MSYGAEERALKLAGNGDIRFGASPLLRAALSARQLDADRFFAKDTKDNAAEPVRVLPALRALMSGIPQSADPGADRTRLRAGHAGRTPVAGYRRRTAWRRQHPGASDRLEFRAPGATRVSLSEADAQERCARTISRPRSTSNSPIPMR